MSTIPNYRIKRRTPWQILDDAVVILSPTNRTAHELDDLGTEIWMQLSKKQRTSEIVDTISEKYAVEVKEAERDVLDFLGELEAKHLVEAI